MDEFQTIGHIEINSNKAIELLIDNAKKTNALIEDSENRTRALIEAAESRTIALIVDSAKKTNELLSALITHGKENSFDSIHEANKTHADSLKAAYAAGATKVADNKPQAAVKYPKNPK